MEYFWHLAQGGCVVDLGEHFVKRSERNRARILATDGAMELTAHVRHADRPRQPMRDMRLDYSKRWQHQHWGALTASYKSSPYFDHYARRFEPFYRREYAFLADYDLQLTELLCSLAHIPMPEVSERYVEAAPGDRTCGPNAERARRSPPSPMSRYSPTGCPSKLICRSRTYFSQRDLQPLRF